MKKTWIQPAVETLVIENTASATTYCWGNTDEFSGPEDNGGFEGRFPGGFPGNNQPGHNQPGNNHPGDFWGGVPGFGKPHH